MTAAEYYNHILATDRNRALMARILINSTEGRKVEPVSLWEMRGLSKVNFRATESYLTWDHWNRPVQFYCDDKMRAIAKE